ncbi:cell wall hydrolase [Hydrogenoanaerobacterium sp.]|uniref:cell wall hydrolase n=1 Tax=Hydrogenoanaerobacterium sp. TaxID=2953763 RepID=UPI002899B726|nr:cell wall hydrolase [Hydrogenoanaerobacterium sp.]
MPFDNREMMARLIKCEAGGEGEDGMRAVATVIMNRATVPYGEFARISDGGNVRNIMEQYGQFNCMTDTLGGRYNAQNIWNMSPEQIHYDIADWALGGGRMMGVDHSLFFFNPYSDTCPPYFPPGGVGVVHNRVNQHCFYIPTENYAKT